MADSASTPDHLDALAETLARYGEVRPQLACRAETSEQVAASRRAARAKPTELIGLFPAGRCAARR